MASPELDEFARLWSECIRDPICREHLTPQPDWVFGVNWITLVVVLAILVLLLTGRKR